MAEKSKPPTEYELDNLNSTLDTYMEDTGDWLTADCWIVSGDLYWDEEDEEDEEE